MRRVLLASLTSFLSFTLLACGGGSGDDTPDAASGTPDAADNNPDAAGNPDAPGAPDAADPTPDATPAALDCLGDPLPTVADDPVATDGDVFDPGIPGFVDPSQLDNIRVEAFNYGDDVTTATPLDSALTGVDGVFALSAATGGQPLNSFIHAKQNLANPTYITAFVYPAVPVTTSQTGVRIPLFSETNFALIQNVTDLSQDNAKGLVTVIVTDCNGDPIQGAYVTSSPAAAQTAYLDSSGLPSTTAPGTDASGLAFLLDVPIPVSETSVEVTIGATYGTDTLRSHNVIVPAFGNGGESRLVTTVVVP